MWFFQLLDIERISSLFLHCTWGNRGGKNLHLFVMQNLSRSLRCSGRSCTVNLIPRKEVSLKCEMKSDATNADNIDLFTLSLIDI